MVSITDKLGSLGEKRITPHECEFPQQGNPGTGGSGVGTIQTVVLQGDPNKPGIYAARAARTKMRRTPIAMTGLRP